MTDLTGINLILIALLPLLGSVLAYGIGKSKPDLAGWIATAAAVGSFVVVASLFQALPDNNAYSQNVFDWISVGGVNLPFALYFDSLTAVMCLVITGVGSLIHLYSIAYMSHDEGKARFFCYLNLFLFSMLILVLGASLPVIFIGWEGVGLCSYLLIGFWYQNESYATAGKKAFVVNRIGDVGFLVGMFLLYANYHTLNLVEISVMASSMPIVVGTAFFIGLAFFIGAVGKSAQIPLFVWLPDAMAGPTPVSALIHAATMVTAGIYLMIRLAPVVSLSQDLMLLVTGVAALTALMAAIIAVTQNDIKKVLAYSTVSQLGFMFMAVGVGAYWVAVFHLVTHAFFKACLFLGAGSVIHACHHEQDMRKMGGLMKVMPMTALTYGVSTLAIAGIAPFSGYYSKHAILQGIATTPLDMVLPFAPLITGVATFTGILTAFYMARSFAMTFLGTYRGTAHPHESPWLMTIPLLVLGALAIIAGLWFEHTLPEYLSSAIGHTDLPVEEGLFLSLIHSWAGLAGVIGATLLYTLWKDIPGMVARVLRPLTELSQNKFYIDELYDLVIVRPLRTFSQFLWQSFDQNGVDFTVNMTGKSIDASGFILSRLQSGQLRFYAISMVLGALFLLTFYVVL